MTTSIALLEPDAMSFEKDGALRIRAALDASDLRRLEDAVANLPSDQLASGFTEFPHFDRFLHQQEQSDR
jgi:hypothetical protein